MARARTNGAALRFRTLASLDRLHPPRERLFVERDQRALRLQGLADRGQERLFGEDRRRGAQRAQRDDVFDDDMALTGSEPFFSTSSSEYNILARE